MAPAPDKSEKRLRVETGFVKLHPPQALHFRHITPLSLADDLIASAPSAPNGSRVALLAGSNDDLCLDPRVVWSLSEHVETNEGLVVTPVVANEPVEVLVSRGQELLAVRVGGAR